ncbi:MAG: hypothetical protein A2Z11_03805 [Candidatus Woykebacteria bacterium RBG_16_43_9]|uniref:Uncharacterized protein n=1 Tax=Candidatus Woykebacteria bacterium RBG_16_43_9 TaxID=1802596 RepID=A0A1G1WD19_9BACT|nr:MAG: hypothetical protein A2Z11_03805 [Candidatus Woykebacteria bacterium RBG_16_43_9]
MKNWLFSKLGGLSYRYLISLGISFIFTFLSALLIWQNNQGFPLAVPLWFSQVWGEGRLAEPVFLWLIPLTSSMVIIVNLIISRFFDQREKMLASILIWSSPVVSGLLFYTLFEIVSVVT